MDKLSGNSKDIVEDNIKKIKELFPEIITENKIDFEKLKETLGVHVENKKERYKFEWHGKAEAVRGFQVPSQGTLRPCKKESKNWDTTKNLYIEGDNLEVLKLLQKTYQSSVKMIYIDPPYNTGNDFVYEDDFKDSIANYVEITEQKNSTNKETDGRRHGNWLNMIYPRLRLARNLLKDDGIIFISIDDNEVHNLRKVCDEIFGESNFIGDVIRKTKSTTNDNKTGFNIQHENTIIYSKNKAKCMLKGELKYFKNYKNPDNDGKGDWISSDPSAPSGSYFEIKNPYTNKIDLPPKNSYWRFSKESFKNGIESGKIKFKKEHKENERGFIYKRYKNEIKSNSNLVNSLFGVNNLYMNQAATKVINKIFNDFKAFDYSKPMDYLCKLIEYTSYDKDDIILDFFSGSGTTAHAVMDLNAKDGGNRKYIMVQLPEKLNEESEAYKEGYKTICDIGKERIRRSGDIVLEENNEKENIKKLDVGFKVFKLDSSNLKKWNPDYDKLELSLDNIINNYVEGRTEEDVLYEIILKFGIDLTYDIEKEKVDNGEIFIIGEGALFVCLSDKITIKVANHIVEKIKQLKPYVSRVVFKDNGFIDDSAKTNIIQILKRNNVEKVMSI